METKRERLLGSLIVADIVWAGNRKLCCLRLITCGSGGFKYTGWLISGHSLTIWLGGLAVQAWVRVVLGFGLLVLGVGCSAAGLWARDPV